MRELLLISGYLAVALATTPPTDDLYSSRIPAKILATAQTTHNPAAFPEYTTRNTGVWQYFVPNTWTTGFFPATPYLMNRRQQLCPGSSSSGTADWLSYGRSWSTAIIPLETNNTLEHDVGFVSFPFAQELLVTPSNATAQTAIINFANDLAARYSPIVGCTRSWDESNPINFTVIIDNMMNLQVFWDAYALNKNTTLINMAISHANKTMVNHVRSDGSSFHVVDYNGDTGAVSDKRTSQGYADNSTWSRGQAWGIYGFANMYNHTGYPAYLTTAQNMANYFIHHLPSTKIVPWDFNAPQNPLMADTSAATIAANGLLLLAKLDTPNSASWTNSAISILNANAHLAWTPAVNWQSLLANGTVNNRASPPNNMTGIVYGDYYFIQAGNTLLEMGLGTCL